LTCLQVHEGRHEEIQECIRTNLGSSKISRQTALVVKERAPGVTAKIVNFAEIFILIFLVPVAFFILDMVTDGLLVSDYFSDMNNATVAEMQDQALETCRANLTLSCYGQAMRAESKFTISLSIMLFPFCFYLVEVVKYFRLKPYNRSFMREAQWKNGSWIDRSR
jgi:hypothetical protein